VAARGVIYLVYLAACIAEIKPSWRMAGKCRRRVSLASGGISTCLATHHYGFCWLVVVLLHGRCVYLFFLRCVYSWGPVLAATSVGRAVGAPSCSALPCPSIRSTLASFYYSRSCIDPAGVSFIQHACCATADDLRWAHSARTSYRRGHICLCLRSLTRLLFDTAINARGSRSAFSVLCMK